MFSDQPQQRPFQSIFKNTPNANPPTDGPGQSFDYKDTGRSDSDNATSKNDLSPFTDKQPKQAGSVKPRVGTSSPDDGEKGDKQANNAGGTMFDDTAKSGIAAPKTIKVPVPKMTPAKKPTKAPVKKAAAKAKKATKPVAKKKAIKKTVKRPTKAKKPVKKAAKKVTKTMKKAAKKTKKPLKKAAKRSKPAKEAAAKKGGKGKKKSRR